MGSKVLLQGRPAKLFPLRMLLVDRTFSKRLLISFVRAFRGHSRSVMGLVFVKLYSQGFGLGIGYTKARFHLLGVRLRDRHLQMMIQKHFAANGPRCFNISFEILDGPGAFPLGSALMVVCHSSSEGGCIIE